MRHRLGVLDYATTNAVLGWLVVGTVLLVAAELALSGEYLAAAVATGIGAVGLVPAVVFRLPTRMPAWEVLALAAVPLVAQYVDVFDGPATYLSVAALALVVAVELDAFTAVEMTPDFAVAFVVVVTMAVAGLRVVAGYAADTYLGTSTLGGQTAVMWNLVAATVVGVVAGLVFELYVRRHSPGHRLGREPRREPG